MKLAVVVLLFQHSSVQKIASRFIKVLILADTLEMNRLVR